MSYNSPQRMIAKKNINKKKAVKKVSLCKEALLKASQIKQEISDQDIWTVSDTYYQDYSFAQHHISGFDHMIHSTIPKMVMDAFPVEEKDTNGQTFAKVEVHEVIFHKPTYTNHENNRIKKLFPKRCEDKNISYLAGVYVELSVTNSMGIQSPREKVLLGMMPAMIKSCICNVRDIMYDEELMIMMKENIYNPGGQFIINGTMRKLIVQEGTENNNAYVYNKKDVYHVEVRSCLDGSMHATTTKVIFDKKKNNVLHVVIPYIDISAIPLAIVFKALGIVDEHDMFRLIYGYDQECEEQFSSILIHTLEYAYDIKTQDDALEFIGMSGKKFTGSNKTVTEDLSDEEDLIDSSLVNDGKKTVPEQAISYARHLLSTEFLPHLGYVKANQNTQHPMFIKKAYFLAKAVRKLILVKLGKHEPDDRDHYANKTNAHAGMLLAKQFSSALRQVVSDIRATLSKSAKRDKSINRGNLINSKRITVAMCSAISNNSWSMRKAANTKGISQTYDSFNHLSALADMHKIKTPISSDSGKINKPRLLHGGQYGIICPYETPEGKDVGLNKSISIQATITTGTSTSTIIDILKVYPIKEIQTLDDVFEALKNKMSEIEINGDIIGFISQPDVITNSLRQMKRSGGIDFEISVIYRDMQIKINCREGRLIRPLLIVENGKIKLKKEDLEDMMNGRWMEDTSNWIKLLTRGFVEYLDNREIESNRIVSYPSVLQEMSPAERLEISHCEFHPSLVTGIGATIIPYMNHNQAPRNCYQAAMGKQAIGIPFANYMFNMKNKFNVLEYPQKQIVYTKASKIIGLDKAPTGQVAVVAVCPWKGQNQEDSIVLNEASIQRGFGCSYVYIPYEAKINPKKNERIEIPLPEECNKFKYGSDTSKLQENGIIKKGTKVVQGDVLIGKTITVNMNTSIHSKSKDNASVIYDQHRPGTVHSVEMGIDGKNMQFVKVVICQRREPVHGDKFACYDTETEVLTDKGWIYFKDLEFSHKVATLVDGKNLKYETPQDIMAFYYDGSMYLLETNQVNLCVTPNHKMWVAGRGGPKHNTPGTYKLLRADEVVGQRKFYQKSVENYISDVPEEEYFILPAYKKYRERRLPMKSWLIFFGIWIAEGCLKDTWSVNISAHKQRVKDALKECLDDMGFDKIKYWKTPHSKDDQGDLDVLNSWHIVDKQLVMFMKQYNVGAINKFLPEWVWDLTAEQCRWLIHGMILGDGNVMKNGTRRYYTASYQLTNDFQRLCLHAGWSANRALKEKKGEKEHIICGKRANMNADYYCLTIVTKQNKPKVNKNKPVDGFFDYRGFIFCCTVPSGVIYVRRNGIPVFCGNCNPAQKGTVGHIEKQINMPVTESGIPADVLINPLAFPSRMTIGLTMEIGKGLVVCSSHASNALHIKQHFDVNNPDHVQEDNKKLNMIEYTQTKNDGDATPYARRPEGYSIEKYGDDNYIVNMIGDELVRLGLNRYGDTAMINGETGEYLNCEIYMGPCYYQRLKHMVDDKMHVREQGKKNILTRQPQEGRKNKGGLVKP